MLLYPFSFSYSAVYRIKTTHVFLSSRMITFYINFRLISWNYSRPKQHALIFTLNRGMLDFPPPGGKIFENALALCENFFLQASRLSMFTTVTASVAARIPRAQCLGRMSRKSVNNLYENCDEVSTKIEIVERGFVDILHRLSTRWIIFPYVHLSPWPFFLSFCAPYLASGCSHYEFDFWKLWTL